ncbi:TIGR03885 family FMN-dependent LLM class oxidoreductase [Desulfocurvibacter africanus]|uniref:TIGR03885 family FMN-dependent LLM class oxidoreductase n=1 Tax=Desulfocurvibacter africanus TaxID=873 RepID=UPI000426110B|nr:TIGR03885 family FMN-dependent LLM class oxidoreductase [Desulfocurvibacter africanus]
MRIGYHASHEQFPPSQLLKLARQAEEAGFQAVLSSDHFHPWGEAQGNSGLAWAWLGAALQATSLPMGVVNAPGQRYHPAIVAQGAATLAEMFPERFWIAVGSGQLLNEGITGDKWPAKQARNERLLESVEIIRTLLAGETVTRHGHVQVEEARLYSRPAKPPAIIGAAITSETAEWVGSWADGLITISQPADKLKEVVEAFRRGGGNGKPMRLKVQLSYARDEKEALEQGLAQWRNNIFPSKVLSDLRLPGQFDAVGSMISGDDLRAMVRVSADLDRHAEWIAEDLEMGFEEVFLHNVNRGQEQFIRDFGKRVLPSLSRLAA